MAARHVLIRAPRSKLNDNNRFSKVQCSNDDLAMRESQSLADVASKLEEIRASEGACSLMMQKVGVGLVVTSYGMLMFTSLAGPAYMRAHPQLKTVMLAEYAAPWPVALGCALGVVGIALALIPIRRGERWAMWTSLATLMVLLIPRITADPRCLVVLDPHQHGCHSFLLAIVLGVVGLVLARCGS
jgi:hypothetical protein